MKALTAATLLSLLMSLLIAIANSPAGAQSIQQVRIASRIDVYSEPSFKSKVVERLNPRSVFAMSTAKVVGKGGLGVFFKIKTPGGKIGYIADSDLVALPLEEPQTTAAGAPRNAKQSPPSTGNDDGDDEAKPTPAAPVPAATMAPSHILTWGGSVATADYAGELNGQIWKHSQIFFGVRRTTSARTAFRLGNDLNMMISPWAPKYLADAGAYGSTSGYVASVEWLLYVSLSSSALAPFFEFGPSAVHSTYQTQLAGSGYSDSKTRIAAVAALGLSYEFSRYCLRIDIHYHADAAGYIGERLSLQTRL